MSRHAATVASLAIVFATGDSPLAAETTGVDGVLPTRGWLDRSPPLAEEPAAEAAPPADSRTPYVAGMIGSSLSGGQAGGFGGTLLTGEGALGVAVPRRAGAVRLEVEGRQRAALSGPRRVGGPGDPPAAVGGEWTTMANLWRDVEVAEHLAVYAGGGLGVGGYSHDADATGPAAASRVTAFGWQAGGGVAYAVTDRLTLDVGGRFYGLEAGVGQPSAGPPAAELLFTVRITDPFQGWLRR
ncbi:MAG: outer membrane protein [Planctomycetota bacterium]